MLAAESLYDRFRRELERASGRFVAVRDDAEASAAVRELAAGGQVVRATDTPSEAALRAASVGVDEADVLVAETGTVVRTFSGRAAARTSLVPPVSVFLARPGILVHRVGDALERILAQHEAGPAYTVFVTGPSRTADIEKKLVIPAHGPRELVVLWIGDARDA